MNIKYFQSRDVPDSQFDCLGLNSKKIISSIENLRYELTNTGAYIIFEYFSVKYEAFIHNEGNTIRYSSLRLMSFSDSGEAFNNNSPSLKFISPILRIIHAWYQGSKE